MYFSKLVEPTLLSSISVEFDKLHVRRSLVFLMADASLHVHVRLTTKHVRVYRSDNFKAMCVQNTHVHVHVVKLALIRM